MGKPVIKRVLLLILALSTTGPAGAQSATALKATEVVPDMYMIEGADGFAGGNVLLLTGAEHVVLIDDFVEPMSDALIASAAELTDSPIDFVINTHAHGDHTGGNAALADLGATVVAHDNIFARMIADDETDPDALPVITFNDQMTFHLNGVTAEVFHVEHAHTDSDAVIHFPEANVIHTGDVMFSGLFPYIDIDSGGSVDGYVAAQKRIAALADDDTVIVPGHGVIATKADLERETAMIEDAYARIGALVEQGLDADAIVAANPLKPYEADWNWRFITTERMTRQLVRDLTD